jgi:hypothetical protein
MFSEYWKIFFYLINCVISTAYVVQKNYLGRKFESNEYAFSKLALVFAVSPKP